MLENRGLEACRLIGLELIVEDRGGGAKSEMDEAESMIRSFFVALAWGGI
jgi:hypothetical protein